ncbi:unnamed protein product [Arctogadus glacialis]
MFGRSRCSGGPDVVTVHRRRCNVPQCHNRFQMVLEGQTDSMHQRKPVICEWGKNIAYGGDRRPFCRCRGQRESSLSVSGCRSPPSVGSSLPKNTDFKWC